MRTIAFLYYGISILLIAKPEFMYGKSAGGRHNQGGSEAIIADNDLFESGRRNQPLKILAFSGHEVIAAAQLTA